ncbi:hypothetical protein SRHO_G00260810 [Serrasalmus rhombeus]
MQKGRSLLISRALLKSEIRKLVAKWLTEVGVLTATHMVDTTTVSLLEPVLSPEREVSSGREVTLDWVEPVVSGEPGKPNVNAVVNEELGRRSRSPHSVFGGTETRAELLKK